MRSTDLHPESDREAWRQVGARSMCDRASVSPELLPRASAESRSMSGAVMSLTRSEITEFVRNLCDEVAHDLDVCGISGGCSDDRPGERLGFGTTQLLRVVRDGISNRS